MYPDFLFTVLRERGEGDRVVALETKGEQLAGNHDTLYKTALLGLLSDAAKMDGAMHLSGASYPFNFGAAVLRFDEIDVRIPTLMQRGGNPAER